MEDFQNILVAGQWINSRSSANFSAFNPKTKEKLPDVFPISSWEDCELILNAATEAANELRQLPAAQIASFLEAYANRIESRIPELAEVAHLETALPISPRLSKVELPRCLHQLRLAAKAAREYSWTEPIIDSKINLRSMLGPVGPVCVFGPNNFPFAYNGISGGDFASAIAAGNPVIAIAHYCHPKTTMLLAEEAQMAADETAMPKGMIQMIYRLDYESGEKLVAEDRVAATGFTGSRVAGLRLKNAAEAAGNLIYLEMSSVNPVVFLPGAIKERGEDIAKEYQGSCLLGTGQFCTNPGLVFVVADDNTDSFIKSVAEAFAAAPIGTLLSETVQQSLGAGVRFLREAGAELLTDNSGAGEGYSHPNTLMKIDAQTFLGFPEGFQTEAFGNSSLIVVAKDVDEIVAALSLLEGNLTGSIYSSQEGDDDAVYDAVAEVLRTKVGRLINDNMPTGVAVSDAMNHGGPYPATGHAGFTAVGMPGSISRFSMLQCFDRVRHDRLPLPLQDKNPTGELWRLIDGNWTQSDL